MARTICVANQKGGVGKTTTSVNLAAALTQLNRRVLIVDMDPQGNASSGLGIKRYENQANNVYQVLIGERAITEAIQATHVPNLDILPANPDLVGAEIELVEMPQREYRLKGAIGEVDQSYDYVLIDCPPSLGLLTVNSLSAAETFLVPLQCEYFALEGLSQLLNTAGLIKKSLNSELRIEGIVLTMFDARNNLSHQVVAEIQSHFSEKVFKAIIPRNVRLSEAPSHGQTIFQYDHKSIGAKRYLELANELDERVHGRAHQAPMTEAPRSALDPPATPRPSAPVEPPPAVAARPEPAENFDPPETVDAPVNEEVAAVMSTAPIEANLPDDATVEAIEHEAAEATAHDDAVTLAENASSADAHVASPALAEAEIELEADAAEPIVVDTPAAEAAYAMTEDAIELDEPFEAATSDETPEQPAPDVDRVHDASEREEPGDAHV